MFGAEPPPTSAPKKFNEMSPASLHARWQKCLIALAGILICTYALWVLWYVHSTPDIGLRTAFDPVIRKIEPNAVFDDQSHTPKEWDRIVSLNGRPVSTWSHVLQYLRDLGDETAVPVSALPAANE